MNPMVTSVLLGIPVAAAAVIAVLGIAPSMAMMLFGWLPRGGVVGALTKVGLPLIVGAVGMLSVTFHIATPITQG